jgi:acyl-coenzyme A synthetase/AMP-(fatty) acid ligase
VRALARRRRPAPGDVERALGNHPAVREVGVVGRDGRGAAFVVLAEDSTASVDELLRFASERLAAHEVPASVELVGQLPRSSVGKLVRGELPG